MYLDDLATEIHERKKRRHLEDDLQSSVVEYLRWALPGNATFWAVPNGGKRHRREAARMVRLGVRAGVPDLTVVYGGRIFCLELKTPAGTVDANQQQMHRKLHACGVPVAVCRSLEEVADALREWGVPLQAELT
jgi:VRR-NUC domain